MSKVESGSRLVGEAGQSVHNIVDHVKRVSDLIAEISAASAEQTQETHGIGQVGDAVDQLDQLDQVTQQNAAPVEQNAAAAGSLKSQAARLAGLVGTFNPAEDVARGA